MIELRISPQNYQHLALQERLEQMSLARKVEEISEKELPSLKDGNQLYEGVSEIHKAIDRLADFKEKWYECTCDKYDWL